MNVYRLSRPINTAMPEGTIVVATVVAESEHEAKMLLLGDLRTTLEQARFWMESPAALVELIGPAGTDYLDRRGENADHPHILCSNRYAA